MKPKPDMMTKAEIFERRTNEAVDEYTDDLSIRLIEIAQEMMESDLGHIDHSIVAQSCQRAMVYAILMSGRSQGYLDKLIWRQREQYQRLDANGTFERERARVGMTEAIDDPNVRCDLETAMILLGTPSPTMVH